MDTTVEQKLKTLVIIRYLRCQNWLTVCNYISRYYQTKSCHANNIMKHFMEPTELQHVTELH